MPSRNSIVSMAAIAACLLSAGPPRVFAQASPPGLVHIEGRLTDAGGVPSNGATNIILRLYDTGPGAGGTLLITDSHTGGGAVTVTNGIYAFDLGSGTITAGSKTTIGACFADVATVWLEMQVGAETLAPRSRMVSAAYALNSDTLDGRDSSYFAAASGTVSSLTGGTGIDPDGASPGAVTISADLQELSLTGLTAGGATSLSVNYGTSANTAVEGNQTGTITAASGLTGDMAANALGDGFSASLAVGAGTGIAVAADSVGFAYSATLGGNPTLNAGEAIFGTTGLIFEGSSGGADASEGLLTVTNPTTDRTWTLPDNSGTIALTSDVSASAYWSRSGTELYPTTAGDRARVDGVSSGTYAIYGQYATVCKGYVGYYDGTSLGAGLYGAYDGAAGGRYGVYGENASTAAVAKYGVYGKTSTTTGSRYGVVGDASNSGGGTSRIGVAGLSGATSISASTVDAAVAGFAVAGDYALYGYVPSAVANNLFALVSDVGGVGTTKFAVNTQGYVSAGTWQANAIGAAYGGTGITSYTTGDLLYASAATTLSKLSAGTSGYVLTANGAGVAPSWQANPAAGANTALSNLTATSINQSLVPNADNTFNLGSSSNRWSNLYLAGYLYSGTVNTGIHYGASGGFGQAAGWNPLTTAEPTGIWMEGGDSESGGFYADGDIAVIYSPGDPDLLRLYDEDDLPAGAPDVVVDGSGNITPGTDNTRSIGTASFRWNDGRFVNLTLGGVTISSWPSGGDNLGNHTATTTLSMAGNSISNTPYIDITPGEQYGIRFWSSDSYAINMGNFAEFHYGPVTDYSIKLNMNNQAGRGWTFGVDGSAPVAAIECQTGNTQVAGSMRAEQGFNSQGNTVIDAGGGWHRSYGATGWYNGTYGGGWYMEDATWVRSYVNKDVYTGGVMQADNGFQVDGYQMISADASTVYGNRSNAAGGGIWVSDDGGFYDYNDAWIRFVGTAGIDLRGALTNAGAGSYGMVQIEDGLRVGNPDSFLGGWTSTNGAASSGDVWLYIADLGDAYHTLSPSTSTGTTRSITNVYCYTYIYHSWPSDVSVYLQPNAAGYVYMYDHPESGSFYQYSSASVWNTSWNGSDPNGWSWTVNTSDEAGGDDGWLVNWTVQVNYDYASTVTINGYGDIWASGHVYAHTSSHVGDLAEFVRVDGGGEAGDIVCVADEGPNRFVKSRKACDDRVAGVISANPSVTINDPKEGMPVALSGRVQVKVTDANGDIGPGDYVTASDTPGIGMKATRACQVVGSALEAWDKPETGKIWILIARTHYDPVGGAEGEIRGAVRVRGYQRTNPPRAMKFIGFSEDLKTRAKGRGRLEDVNITLTAVGGAGTLFVESVSEDGFTVVSQGECTGFYFDFEVSDLLPEGGAPGTASTPAAPPEYALSEPVEADQAATVKSLRIACLEEAESFRALNVAAGGRVDDYSKYPELRDRLANARQQKIRLLTEHPWAKQYIARRPVKEAGK
ncbi:MAG: hypothetical protein HYY93_10035 [Planctomycetes bacterium]|nr:hypothetical protein [Planctomycetota bacterium]